MRESTWGCSVINVAIPVGPSLLLTTRVNFSNMVMTRCISLSPGYITMAISIYTENIIFCLQILTAVPWTSRREVAVE